MRILVSGGGTGGHISPVLAVISELKKIDQDIEILYVGSKEGLEAKIIPQTGLDYRGISSGKFRRYHNNLILNLIDPTTIIKNIVDLFRFIKGIFEARGILKEFDPDIIFTKGGFVSLPVGIAARSLGYPYIIHESDVIMGLSNKILAKSARKICVSYPTKYYPEFSDEALVYTGNPVREDILAGNKENGQKEFNISSKRPVIMVIGGSQGALIINQLIAKGFRRLLEKYEVIHVSGERDYDWLTYQASKIEEKNKKYYHLYNFLSGNLKDAYAVSDLVISRAGNNVIAELALLKKPTILIPLSTSANNHQVENARIISRMGAGIMMLQEHLTPEKIARQVDLLFEEREELVTMGEKLHELPKPEAAIEVAREIYNLGKEFQDEEGDNEEQED